MNKKGQDGSKGIAILLLLALLVAGVIMAFNIGNFTFLGLSFKGATGFGRIFWLVLARVAGVGLVVASIAGIIGIIRSD